MPKHESRIVDTSIERATTAAAIGLTEPTSPEATQQLRTLLEHDPDPRVRTAALGAILRIARREDATIDAGGAWLLAACDPDPRVRSRACEEAPSPTLTLPNLCDKLFTLLQDPDASVAESAAWALGELGERSVAAGAVAELSKVATQQSVDPLVREAATAALGALGDPRGLPAILVACHDKPAIRRRAVLALAPFEGPAVESAIDAALADRDWQVRQAAEDLRRTGPGAGAGPGAEHPCE